METLLEILKYTIPAIVVLITAYQFFNFTAKSQILDFKQFTTCVFAPLR